MLTEAYLALGSNLGDRRSNIAAGLAFLERFSSLIAVSSLYETAPQGFSRQPPFINAACRMWTRLSPFELLARAGEAEAQAGRGRSFPNGPRTLDVDILIYGRAVLSGPLLSIPHPRMAERAFVLAPLAEIAPNLLHPLVNDDIRSMLKRLGGAASIRRVSQKA